MVQIDCRNFPLFLFVRSREFSSSSDQSTKKTSEWRRLFYLFFSPLRSTLLSFLVAINVLKFFRPFSVFVTFGCVRPPPRLLSLQTCVAPSALCSPRRLYSRASDSFTRFPQTSRLMSCRSLVHFSRAWWPIVFLYSYPLPHRTTRSVPRNLRTRFRARSGPTFFGTSIF